MAKLQDLKYDGKYVFSKEYREFLDKGISRYAKPLIEAAEKLTVNELEWLWEDALGAFECTHPDYKSPPDELLKRAGPLTWFFNGYGMGVSENC